MQCVQYIYCGVNKRIWQPQVLRVVLLTEVSEFWARGCSLTVFQVWTGVLETLITSSNRCH